MTKIEQRSALSHWGMWFAGIAAGGFYSWHIGTPAPLWFWSLFLFLWAADVFVFWRLQKK